MERRNRCSCSSPRADVRMAQVHLSPLEGAAEFMRSELRRGRGLARLVEDLDLDRGRIAAFLPPGPVNELPERFATGALPSADDEQAAVEALADFLVRDLGVTRSDDRYLLAQFADSATARPERRAGSKEEGGYSVAWLTGADRSWEDRELWFVGPDHEQDALAALLADNLWFPATAVVISAGTLLRDDAEVRSTMLAPSVADAAVALVGGWGATNYLIWMREQAWPTHAS